MKLRLLSLLVIVFCCFAAFTYMRYRDGYLHVIFCNVGQGDGILIKTPSGKIIIADGGPDGSIVKCLNNHMPFWERNIDLVLLSHPHQDHLVGFLEIVPLFHIKQFVTEKIHNTTLTYSYLDKLLKDAKIPQDFVYKGDSFKFKDGVILKIISPDKEYLAQTSPHGVVGEQTEFASLITRVEYGKFTILLTGDSQVSALERTKDNLSGIEILQAPHHGSRTGLNEDMLEYISPQSVVISVGKNTYGHPAKEVLTLLEKLEIPIIRTDQKGDVEYISDGEKWWMKR